ncbi:MAG: hypothetical protein U5K79_14220 [Cyclobacteriaceae bacterium]|nr:hypothetical protein [Cyclobacteriaceae bacterium]
MKHFAELINALTNARNEDARVRAVFRYFNNKNLAGSFDSAAALLVGNNIPSVLTTRQLKSWASSLFPELPGWLFERSVEESGNIVNAVALLLRKDESVPDEPSLPETLEKLQKLHGASEQVIKLFLNNTLAGYGQPERAVILRMMSGTFKSPVTKLELLRGLARVFAIPEAVATLRWYNLEKKKPFEIQLLGAPVEGEDELLPIQIKPPEIIERPGESLGEWNDWQAHGIRTGMACQLVKHGKTVHLWVDGPEIVSELFTEITRSLAGYEGDLIMTGQLIPKSLDQPVSILQKYITEDSAGRQSGETIFVVRDVYLNRSGKPETDLPMYVSGRVGPHITFEPRLLLSSSKKSKSFIPIAARWVMTHLY